jgi:DNA-binding CsgD family transcriptional regulator
MIVATVDHGWRIRDFTPDAAELLGWNPEERGTALVSTVHPDDVPQLLLIIGKSSAERRAAEARLRFRASDGTWPTLHFQVSPLCDHSPPRLAVALWPPASAGRVDRGPGQPVRLERLLRQIALEVHTAGLLDPAVAGEWSSDPALRTLSPKQWEVLTRLARGERVPNIARDMHVSDSTVRNHLSAIFQKVGVHSQAELLASLRQGGGAPGNGD